MADDPLAGVREAIDGLIYPSEGDHPFDLFTWPATGPATAKARVAALAGKGRKVRPVPVDEFFADLSATDDGPRFDQLRKALDAALAGIDVLRIEGTPRVEIYVVGKTAKGLWAGVHTVSIET